MPLTINDYQNAATKLGVDVASVRAVASVESKGNGLFSDGRPVILYERHIFYKELLNKRNKETKARIEKENPNIIGNALAIIVANELRNVKNELDKLALQNSTICNTQAGGYLGE